MTRKSHKARPARLAGGVAPAAAIGRWLRRPFRFDTLLAMLIAIMLVFMDAASPVFWLLLGGAVALVLLTRVVARRHTPRSY